VLKLEILNRNPTLLESDQLKVHDLRFAFTSVRVPQQAQPIGLRLETHGHYQPCREQRLEKLSAGQISKGAAMAPIPA